MMMEKTIEELNESDLFMFFGLEEENRSQEGDLSKVHFKTGGFQEFIDIYLWTDGAGVVRRAELYLDREWIGNEERLNPFGKDIAKSFIAGLMPAEGCPYVEGIIYGLWGLSGSKDEVMYLNPEDEPKPATDPVILSALDVYTGAMDQFELGSPFASMLLSNAEEDGRQRFVIDIAYRREPL